jgi:3-methyladenine DNA glycosylase/8-oxoguanine DNA glycosylase
MRLLITEGTTVKDLLEAEVPPTKSCSRLSAAEDIAIALEHLRSVDPLLKGIIELHDPPQFQKCESAFSALARSIVYQQLATKAASCIFGRLLDLCGVRSKP